MKLVVENVRAFFVVSVTPSFFKAETPLESCLECLSREKSFLLQAFRMGLVLLGSEGSFNPKMLSK